jgi:hypothetical protein
MLLLCSLVAAAAGSNICSVHKKQMTKKKVEVIILVCRHNHDEWQQYTNARARLFPNSGDEIYVNADEVMHMKSKQLEKKYGWKRVPSQTWVYVCSECDERKGKWQAEHPAKKYKKDEIPPP